MIRSVTTRALVDKGPDRQIADIFGSEWTTFPYWWYSDYGGQTYSIATYDLVINHTRGGITNNILSTIREQFAAKAIEQGVTPIGLAVFRDDSADDRGETHYQLQFAAAGASPVAAAVFALIGVLTAELVPILILIGAIIVVLNLQKVIDLVNAAVDLIHGRMETVPVLDKNGNSVYVDKDGNTSTEPGPGKTLLTYKKPASGLNLSGILPLAAVAVGGVLAFTWMTRRKTT